MRKRGPFGPKATRGGHDPRFGDLVGGDEAVLRHVRAVVACVVHGRDFRIPPEDRRDVVQEVMIEVWRQAVRPDFSFDGPIDRFVRTVAYRRCIDWTRRAGRAIRADPLDADEPEGAVGSRLAFEQLDLIIRVLRELRQPCREIVLMALVEGRTPREIATLQGRSDGAVRTQIWQCQREMRDIARRLLSTPGRE